MATKADEKGLLASLDSFWFDHGSPTSLGVFRIFMGGLVLLNLVMIAPYWADWFSEAGFVPTWIVERYQGSGTALWYDSPVMLPRIDLLRGVTNPLIAFGFYVVVTLAAFTTTIGLWTRVSSIVLAVGLVSLHHRNGLILHGGDTVMRVMCLYLAIAPCGGACSVDRMRRLWSGKDTGEPVRISLWSQRLIMFNVALIYFTTTWLKWFGSLWKDGTATWYTGRLAEFYRFPVPDFVNEAPFVQLTTWGTLATEFALATLVFYKPFRKYVLLAGILMHGWIDYSMNIPLFSWLMVSTYVCFYEGEEVQGWFRRVGQRLQRLRVDVLLPRGMQLTRPGSAFFDAADPLKLTTYLQGESEALEPVQVRRSKSRSLGAWPVAWIPGFWRGLMLKALTPSTGDEEKPGKATRQAKPKKEVV